MGSGTPSAQRAATIQARRASCPWVPHAALLATVAPPGEAIPIAHLTGHQPMMVGPHASRTVPRTGELYLGINDQVRPRQQRLLRRDDHRGALRDDVS